MNSRAVPEFRVDRQGCYRLRRGTEEHVVVHQQPDGSWDRYTGGHHGALGIWTETPPPNPNLLNWLGLKKNQQPVIAPEKVKPATFVYEELPEVYNDSPLPRAPQPKNYSSLHYHVDLKVDPRHNRVQGKVKLIAQSLGEQQQFSLDLEGFSGQIHGVRVDGRAADFKIDEGKLEVDSPRPLPHAQRFEAEIEFSNRPQPLRHPGNVAELGWNHTEGGTYTLNGSPVASSWFPVNNDPQDKATYEFQLTVPKGYRGIATGRLQSRYQKGDHEVFHYRSGTPSASYLTAVHVLDSKHYSRLEFQSPDGLLVELDFPTNKAQLAHDYLNKSTEMLGFLSERLGPYPQETFGAVVVDGLRTNLGNGITLLDPESQEYRLERPLPVAFEAQGRPIYDSMGTDDDVVFHEIAHQWFGNSVTPKSESDIWISEAFPSYADKLWMFRHNDEALEAEMQMIQASLVGHKFSDTAAAPAPEKLFSQPSYRRMELSMHALRRTLGDRAFYGTLRSFLSRYRDASASVTDFEQLAREENPGKLEGFFEAWLHSKELPDLPRAQPAGNAPTTLLALY